MAVQMKQETFNILYALCFTLSIVRVKIYVLDN